MLKNFLKVRFYNSQHLSEIILNGKYQIPEFKTIFTEPALRSIVRQAHLSFILSNGIPVIDYTFISKEVKITKDQEKQISILNKNFLKFLKRPQENCIFNIYNLVIQNFKK